jgi:AhpD family alkylhydroperoxidase
MSQRMNYNSAAPAGMKALGAAYGYIRTSELPSRLVDLVYLRVSQINGCAYCIDMHSRDLLNAGMRIEHLVLVPVWSEAGDAFTEQEKAALAWAEAVTRVSEGGVPDVAFQTQLQYLATSSSRSYDRNRSYERLQPYRDQLSRDACGPRGLILPPHAIFVRGRLASRGIAASADRQCCSVAELRTARIGSLGMAPRAHLLIGSASAALLAAAGALSGPGATAQTRPPNHLRPSLWRSR